MTSLIIVTMYENCWKTLSFSKVLNIVMKTTMMMKNFEETAQVPW